MTNLLEQVKEEVYRLAKLGDIYTAYHIVVALDVWGNMSSDEFNALRQNVCFTYLKSTDKPIEWGVVEYYEYRNATVLTSGEDQYIGLSPSPHAKFSVTDFVYNKHGNSLVALFEVENEWFYVNFNPHQKYGGRVVGFYKGTAWVVPYFDLTQIKAKAQELIDELGGVDYHEWERPKNFSMDSADYAHIQEEQTELALDHYGFNYAD